MSYKRSQRSWILTGNYNKQPFDQTRWYALTDKAYALFGQVPPHRTKLSDAEDSIVNSIGQNCPMERTESSDGLNEIVRPIPDRNTNRNSDTSGGDDDVAVTAEAISGSVGGHAPTLSEVRDFIHGKRLHIDPERFFEVNQLRGWKTKDGKPVDDWRQYALTWERYEVAREPVQTAPASGEEKPHEPSVDEVMRDYRCDRAMAEELIREHLA